MSSLLCGLIRVSKLSELSDLNALEELQQKWPALLRGQILSATLNKLMVIMRLADQKAQVLIFLNSILVPVCLNSLNDTQYSGAAIVSVVTAVLSIFAAMVCIYPKRKYRKSGHRDLNILHFNDIGHMKQDDFMDQFMPILNDGPKLCETVAKDIYDISRYSMIPKFFWLKISYAVFCFGNLIAIVIAIMES